VRRAEANQQELSDTHRAVLEAYRDGLNGNRAALLRSARRIVRDGVEEGDSQLRNALTRLLVDSVAAPSGMRRLAAPSPIAPVDRETALPLASIQQLDDARRPVLAQRVIAQVDAVIAEHAHADRLFRAGTEPTKTLLLCGPPGVGKTMTANYLASALALPLVSVELASLMSSFLGRTGQNLRELLDYARETACVLLLDEFDALAKRRDDVTDVGELKRIVNVLLLELERWPATSLLIAATNHPHLLDPAIERRFDVVVDLGLPDTRLRLAILKDALTNSGAIVEDGASLVAVAVATEGYSGAHLQRLLGQALRSSVICRTTLDHELAALALEKLRDRRADRGARALFSRVASVQFGLSNREIARLLDVTHPTVSKLIAEAEDELVALERT
jgi:SpoVK/Ycf46/Vps4 family AAA+-type ATPase